MPLQASVYTTPPIPWILPNGKSGGLWSPTSITLIHGQKEALLVDTPITIAQTEDLIRWIQETIPTKKLTQIYITHGHADHWAGLSRLKQSFPHVKAYATKATIKHMKEDANPKYWKQSWGAMFPDGQINESLEFADPLPTNGELRVDGYICKAVEVGHADTRDSTVLWVPSLKLAVCGDVVYGDVHLMFGEANTPALRKQWIAAINQVAALGPELIVGGHVKAGELSGTYHLAATKEYIKAFDRILPSCKSAGEVKAKMLELYPTRYNSAPLEWGCNAAFGRPLFARL
jgi:glyoxylase-like metal-dependent hydrolase (beta-lactamase superfamily II)